MRINSCLIYIVSIAVLTVCLRTRERYCTIKHKANSSKVDWLNHTDHLNIDQQDFEDFFNNLSEWASASYFQLSNCYRYSYDGTSRYIFDGGLDMYDTGNEVTHLNIPESWNSRRKHTGLLACLNFAVLKCVDICRCFWEQMGRPFFQWTTTEHYRKSQIAEVLCETKL